MICFPLDDTQYDASALGAWCGMRTRGVASAQGHFTVTTNGDMSVTVSPGLAWLKAGDYWAVVAHEPEPQTLTLGVGDGSLSRIDAVCIRLNKAQNRAELLIKKGTPATLPKVTAPVRDLNYDEIYVATVTVRPGTLVIQDADITDQRLNSSYCGLAQDSAGGIPNAHAGSHAKEGSDPITPAMIGVDTSAITAHMSNAGVHVTAADKTTWNSAPVSRGQTSNPNAITTTGLYYMAGGTPNAPDTSGYMLACFMSGGRGTQIAAVNGASSRFWIRSYLTGTGGGWQSWRKVVTSDMFSYSAGTLNITI